MAQATFPASRKSKGSTFVMEVSKPGAFCQAVENLTDVATDIEDMLKTVAFIRGHKWTSMMIKRVYFGNW